MSVYKQDRLYRIDVLLNDGVIEWRKTLPKRWKTFRGVMREYTRVFKINPHSVIVREKPTYKEISFAL